MHVLGARFYEYGSCLIIHIDSDHLSTGNVDQDRKLLQIHQIHQHIHQTNQEYT